MNEAEIEEKQRTLLARLQLAMELEWATLPPYLVAVLSIKRSSNREAADLIRGVAMEEMLHLALVANVMNAVSGHRQHERQRLSMIGVGRARKPPMPTRNRVLIRWTARPRSSSG